MKSIDCKKIYWDGRHYDLINADILDDIPFFIQQAEAIGGPILELAGGTGRIAIPLAEQGFDVTGLDMSPDMLKQARKKTAAKNLSIRWKHADCRNFHFKRRFGLILLPFNSIAHLHDPESIEGCLRCVGRHLSDDGRFIIDIFNPRLEILMRDPSLRYPVVEYDDPDGRGRVTVTENNVYDKACQINRIKWYFKIGNTPEFYVELNMRVFFPQEIDALLTYNGFEIECKLGDYDQSVFTSASPKQIIICKSYGARFGVSGATG